MDSEGRMPWKSFVAWVANIPTLPHQVRFVLANYSEVYKPEAAWKREFDEYGDYKKSKYSSIDQPSYNSDGERMPSDLDRIQARDSNNIGYVSDFQDIVKTMKDAYVELYEGDIINQAPADL